MYDTSEENGMVEIDETEIIAVYSDSTIITKEIKDNTIYH